MRLIVVGDCVALKHSRHKASATSGQPSSVDRKGIKRGRCQEQDCADCDSYFYDPLKGSQCQYCGCYPTKHQKLDGSSDEVLEISDSDEPKDPDPSLPPEVHIIDNGSDTVVYEVDEAGQLVQPEHSNKTSQNVDHCIKAFTAGKDQQQTLEVKPVTFDNLAQFASRDHLYGFCVPINIPGRTSKTRFSADDQQFIIKWISWNMWNLQVVTEKDFLEVAKLALHLYPELVLASNDSGKTGLAKALRSHLGDQWALSARQAKVDPTKQSKPKPVLKPIQNPAPKAIQNLAPKTLQSLAPPAPKTIRSSSSSTAADPQLTPTVQQDATSTQSKVCNAPRPIPTKHYEHFMLHTQKEMNKVNPSLAIFRTFLSSCRKERQLISKHQSISAQIDDFPCLQLCDVVVWEFIQQEQLECSFEDLKQGWLDALPQLIMFVSSRLQQETPDVLFEGQATIEVLRGLIHPACFGPSNKSEPDRASHVIELYQGTILPLFIFPQKGDPPRLFALGNVEDENLVVCVYVEGKVFFKGYVVDALIHLIACYSVFNAKSAPETEAAYAFLYGVFLKEKAEERYKKFSSVVSALELLKHG